MYLGDLALPQNFCGGDGDSNTSLHSDQWPITLLPETHSWRSRTSASNWVHKSGPIIEERGLIRHTWVSETQSRLSIFRIGLQPEKEESDTLT